MQIGRIAGGSGRQVDLELCRAGSGRIFVILHGMEGLRRLAPFTQLLSAHGELVAPSHPGFGLSTLPAPMRTVADLAYFYLDLLEQLDLSRVVLIGANFGGWIAAEMAIRSTGRLAALALFNPFGIRVGAADEQDIADVFALSQSELLERSYFDAAAGRLDPAGLDEESATALVRDKAGLAHYGWSPFMHSPSLRNWLHRVRIPTLVCWGEHDALVPQSYGRAYASAIPDSVYTVVGKAGVYPHLEQPAAVVETVLDFIASKLEQTEAA